MNINKVLTEFKERWKTHETLLRQAISNGVVVSSDHKNYNSDCAYNKIVAKNWTLIPDGALWMPTNLMVRLVEYPLNDTYKQLTLDKRHFQEDKSISIEIPVHHPGL